MQPVRKDRTPMKRRTEDFFSRRNRLGAKLIMKQQQEEKEKARERALADTSIDRAIRAE